LQGMMEKAWFWWQVKSVVENFVAAGLNGFKACLLMMNLLWRRRRGRRDRRSRRRNRRRRRKRSWTRRNGTKRQLGCPAKWEDSLLAELPWDWD
jgi:hypothetical protein